MVAVATYVLCTFMIIRVHGVFGKSRREAEVEMTQMAAQRTCERTTALYRYLLHISCHACSMRGKQYNITAFWRWI